MRVKVSMSSFITSQNPHFVTVGYPVARGCIAGGSSGGSAAAVRVENVSMPVHTAMTRSRFPFKLSGMPAMTLPCGKDAQSPPVNVPLAGHSGKDPCVPLSHADEILS